MRNIFDSTRMPLTQRKPGQLQTATILNEPVAAAERLISPIVAPTQPHGDSTGGQCPTIGRFTMPSATSAHIKSDYLVCLRTYYDNRRRKHTEQVLIAKPVDHRRTWWEGVTWKGFFYNYYIYDGYVLANSLRRVYSAARYGDWGGQGEASENMTQGLIPMYEVGEEIIAIHIPQGTSVWVEGERLYWQDLNVAGRTWAQVLECWETY